MYYFLVIPIRKLTTAKNRREFHSFDTSRAKPEEIAWKFKGEMPQIAKRKSIEDQPGELLNKDTG